MPTPPLSDQDALAALEAEGNYKRKMDAAASLGLNPSTFHSRVKEARKRGLHLSGGARETIQRAGLHAVEAKGGWKHIYDDEGKKLESVRWSAPEQQEAEFLGQLADAFSSVKPAKPVAAPQATLDDYCTLYPMMDVHLGMLAWGRETGGEDYNLELASEDMHLAFAKLDQLTPKSHSAILVIGGDFFHADDNNAQTPAHKHNLDVDSRHWKVLDSGVTLIASVLDMLLKKHQHVTIRVLRGNHDVHAHLVLTFALAERYRDEPRVEVEKNPRDIFMRQWGKCLISAHHGDKAKPDKLVLMMAEICPFWSDTRHRHIFTGHVHHDRALDITGMKWESLRAFCPPDSYAASMGYAPRRAMQTLTFHKQDGLVLRAIDPVER